jgi:hypothetical protein
MSNVVHFLQVCKPRKPIFRKLFPKNKAQVIRFQLRSPKS